MDDDSPTAAGILALALLFGAILLLAKCTDAKNVLTDAHATEPERAAVVSWYAPMQWGTISGGTSFPCRWTDVRTGDWHDCETSSGSIAFHGATSGLIHLVVPSRASPGCSAYDGAGNLVSQPTPCWSGELPPLPDHPVNP